MNKGSNSTRQVTTATPWSGVAKPLEGAVKDATSLYGKGAPSYYPGQTVAPLSGYTQGAIDWQAQRAQAGSPLTQAGQTQLTDTLGGRYLDEGNPYFQRAVQSAIRPVTEQYQNVVMPGIQSMFSDAGRYGSGAMNGQGGAMDMANQGYMRQVGDIASNMAYQNYADERGNILKAGLLAPEMAQQDYFDINQLGTAGSMLDQQNQNLINADVARYDYNANKDTDWLSNYMGLLQQSPWGQTSTTTPPSPNMFTSALGGGLAGGSLFGLPGALIGGGAGLLSSFF